jgi:hypothetical protein
MRMRLHVSLPALRAPFPQRTVRISGIFRGFGLLKRVGNQNVDVLETRAESALLQILAQSRKYTGFSFSKILSISSKSSTGAKPTIHWSVVGV